MNILSYFLRFIFYYLISKTKHGVHSPFVFKLLTQAIQTKKSFYFNRNKKNRALIFRLLLHFEPKSILEIGNKRLSKKSIIYYHDFQNIKKELIDFIYIEKSTMELLKKALKYMHNDSVLVLNNIHRNKEEWNFLQVHSKVNVSINLFYIGLVFLREQQEEEHFTIRF